MTTHAGARARPIRARERLPVASDDERAVADAELVLVSALPDRPGIAGRRRRGRSPALPPEAADAMVRNLVSAMAMGALDALRRTPSPGAGAPTRDARGPPTTDR